MSDSRDTVAKSAPAVLAAEALDESADDDRAARRDEEAIVGNVRASKGRDESAQGHCKCVSTQDAPASSVLAHQRLRSRGRDAGSSRDSTEARGMG